MKKTPKTLLLQASARSDGNTHQIVQALRKQLDFDVIDLKTKHIESYSYERENQSDDFLPIMRDIAENYDLLVFATPVYWYSMSGLLKNFLDRLTDCISIEKQLGRQLRGKQLASLSCGSDAIEVDGFHTPFRLTAEYLDMNYIAEVHTWIAEDEIEVEVLERIVLFSEQLKAGKLTA